MIFRQLLDNESKTYTYLLGDPWSREAAIIDPVLEQFERDTQIIEELGLKLVYSLETHCHADHVTGGGLLRARHGCKTGAAKVAGIKGVDIELTDGDALRFGLQALEVRSTPGHTAGCVSYVTADRSKVFTGDALMIRGCGRTDFQEGDPRTLYRSLRDKIFSLPDDTLVYPGHDYKGRTVSSVGEEKAHNPRLAGKSEDEFAAIMDGLKLAYPRKIDVALPANKKMGILDEAKLAELESQRHKADWDMERSPTGAPQVSPGWVAQHTDWLRIVDVREAEEFSGPDGHITGADLVPMARYKDEAASWNKDAKLVLVCRSGGRSDTAALELEKAGFRSVASLRGGMLRWNQLGLPVAGIEQG
jgi:glyoxylase-like metal-dependent hydrolase (beta-lactamase superfamily II)/rhodanese-related sulfurtransferase